MPNFDKIEVSILQAKLFEPLILDYLAGGSSINGLFEYSPDLEGLMLSLEKQKNRPVNRGLLVEVLKEQYAFLENSPEKESVFERIDSLQDLQSFTICTGHQLNLFTGPLYTIFKIITTIRAASALSNRSGKVILPVFWLASEDHDIDEINHVFLYGHKFVWPTEWKGASGRVMCQGITEVIANLRTKYGNLQEASEILDVLESCYRPDLKLADATRRFLHHLFGKHGLLILDGDDRRLKKAFLPNFISDAFDHLAESKVNETISKIPPKYKIQVHPRRVNLFYLSDNRRERIESDGDNFHTTDKQRSWTRVSFEKELMENPERFSPNVVLRPLYQESILPDIAVVGGPAEIAYWLELKSFFQSSNVSFPVLLLRNSAMFVDEHASKRMHKLNIKMENLFESIDEWIHTYLKSGPALNFSIQDQLHVIETEFNSIGARIDKIDPTIKATLEAEHHRTVKGLKVVEEKVLRSIKKRHETEINQINKVHEKLFPFGKLQERTENILPLLFKYGSAFIDKLITCLEPFNKSIVIFKEMENQSSGSHEGSDEQ